MISGLSLRDGWRRLLNMPLLALVVSVAVNLAGLGPHVPGPVLAAIRAEFGARVARVVEGCSDAFGEPKPEWWRRKRAHLRRLRAADGDVKLVYAADKVHNARSIVADRARIGARVWSRFRAGRKGSLWYYRAMLEVLRHPRTHELIAELAELVEDLERAAPRGRAARAGVSAGVPAAAPPARAPRARARRRPPPRPRPR